MVIRQALPGWAKAPPMATHINHKIHKLYGLLKSKCLTDRVEQILCIVPPFEKGAMLDRIGISRVQTLALSLVSLLRAHRLMMIVPQHETTPLNYLKTLATSSALFLRIRQSQVYRFML